MHRIVYDVLLSSRNVVDLKMGRDVSRRECCFEQVDTDPSNLTNLPQNRSKPRKILQITDSYSDTSAKLSRLRSNLIVVAISLPDSKKSWSTVQPWRLGIAGETQNDVVGIGERAIKQQGRRQD